MTDNEYLVNEILQENVNDFIQRIGNLTSDGYYRKNRRIISDFSELKLANSDFYEYAYFERILEWFTRDILINKTFHSLFEMHGIQSLWPDSHNYVNRNTSALENVFPFEFIIVTEKKKIGFRYTNLFENEIDELLDEYHINEIIVICWKEDIDSKKVNNSKYRIMKPIDFFTEYFTKEDYYIFIQSIKYAIDKANSLIGFETIPRLSLRYLSNFKREIKNEIKNTSFEKIRYQVLSASKKQKHLNEFEFSTSDYELMNKNFIIKGLYRSLVGSEGFAKCFVTAEYQYSIFKQGHNFDFTSIVCGYLKAVEQLIYKIIKINLEYPSNDELWIKKNSKKLPKSMDMIRRNPITNKFQVAFEPAYESYFDITLTPMIWFLHDNINGWKLSLDGREIIHSYLLNFASECRNDHFHKDNIDDFEKVNRIRNNTKLIIFSLLGGYKLTDDDNLNLKLLGVEENSFERFFTKLQELPKGITKFIIQYSGISTIKAYRHSIQNPVIYNGEGMLMNANIRFVQVDKFGKEEYTKAMEGEYAESEFIVDKDNVPEKIFYINGMGEEIPIEW